MKQLAKLSVFLFSFLLSGALLAQNLTTSQIDQWIKTMQAFNQYDDIDFEDMDDDGAADMNDMMDMDAMYARMIEEVKKSPEAMGVLRQHGFTPEEWADTSQRITMAYAALEMEREGGGLQEMQREFAQTMRELDNNPHMSEAQKEQIRQQMGMAQGMMDQFANAATDADKKAVSARRQQLQALFDGDD